MARKKNSNVINVIKLSTQNDVWESTKKTIAQKCQSTAIISIILKNVHMKNLVASSSMKNPRTADFKEAVEIPFVSFDIGEMVKKSLGNVRK